MRVLHVAGGDLYGGIERMLATLAGTTHDAVTQQFAVSAGGRLWRELRDLGATAAERLEDDIEAALWERRLPVPRPVKGDERAAPVAFGEHPARVEHQRVGRPVRRVRRDIPLLAGAAPFGSCVAAILRCEHLPSELRIVVAVRPAEIVTALDAEELLRRRLGALHGIEERRPVPVAGRARAERRTARVGRVIAMATELRMTVENARSRRAPAAIVRSANTGTLSSWPRSPRGLRLR